MSLFLTCVLAASAPAQVVLSEIHYHPVEEPAFDAEGDPVLDLTDDVFEFVEIQNAGTATVDLSGWTLAGGISYTFPAGVTIAPGGFRVIAKAPALLAAVYSLDVADVLGPYSGHLGNSSDTVRLRNATGNTVDSVTYGSLFPWAQSADALGAQDRFLGLNSSDYQYKGRSLQRVSVTWPSGDPANWLASPLSGPTPGAPQAVTRDEPKPIVVAFSAVQASDGAVIIRPGADATVNCTYSSTNNLSNVVLEYFVDNINATGETRTSVTMTGLGDGRFTATIPGQPSRSVVRYRFLADRGDGLEVVSPRADDPQIAPVGDGGAREAWHGYFVTPVRSSSNAAVYDVLVSSAGLSTMSTNITQNPRRVTAASATGLPREVPYVASTAPQWNGTVPAVFACNGELWDIHIRYHGSRYHRTPSTHSYKLHFPEHHPLNGQTAWFETLHGTEFIEAQQLNRLLGLPASKMRRVDWYFNSSSNEVHSEQGEYAGEMLEEYHKLQQQLNPGSELEESGELYKDVGNREAEQNNTEGPYTRGTSAPMLANSGWTQLQRYEWTFSLQNHDWKGPKPLRDLIEGMWAARGDTISTHNFSSDPAKLARAKQWFLDNFDMETTLTSMALLEWMSIWDDACQNHFFWRRANGKWSRLGWDYDQVMASGGMGGGATQTIYGGEYGAPTVFDGVNWWKDTFYKCFREEYKKRLWELTNSFCDATNLAAMGFSRAAAFAPARKTYINSQLSALGTYYKPNRPTNASPANGAAVVGAASLVTSAYSHPQSTAHGSTRWEIRTLTGNYEEPVLRTTTSAFLTSFPIPFEQLTYGQTYYWRATHIDANGHPSVVSAETSFTWGTVNTTAGAIVLNEVLASNRNTVQNGGGFPDYVEIRNNGTTPASLSGFTVTDDPLTPGKFAFPEGTTLPADGYLVVWCDSDTSAPGLHTGFAVDADGETLLLMNGGAIVDSVSFGPQAPDVSIGRIVNGTGGWQANEPTPGTSNNARTLGSVSSLRINEWMADPAYGDDWFELYNTDTNVVALGGLYLSDTPSSPAITRIPPLSFIEAGGHPRFVADGSDAGGNHVNFKLSKSGESLVLTASNGATTIDTITFSTQVTDVSQGRLPDGSSTIVSCQGQTASLGFCNWAPNGVYINELLANSVWPLEDAVEIVNANASPVDISGWWLTDDLLHRCKYRIPAGTVIPAGGHAVFYAADLAAGASPVEFNARGDEAMLSAVNGSGALTGYGSLVRFGASAENVSFGRVGATGLSATSGGAEFWPLTAHTFGNDDAATPESFRTGRGKANAAAMSGPVVINEVMYHPPDFAGDVDDTRDEFIEIVNFGSLPVDLGGWCLRGGTAYTFPVGTTLAAGANLLVVGFDPSDAATLAAFKACYGLGGSLTVHGPFSNKLANSTAVLELAYPATINGFASFVDVDRVEYRDIAPWPVNADGKGMSLQRISSAVIGNTASNWSAATPTPGAATVPFFYTTSDVSNCLRWAAGLAVVPSSGVSTYDVVTDGRVNMLDAVRIARKVAGLDSNP
jgi:hypothetical protein